VPQNRATFIFGFCSLILTIFSPLQSEIISAHIWNKIYQPTLTTLLHCPAKYEQVQFCKTCIVLLIFL